MITNQITNSTIERQTLSWGKSINNNLLRSQIRSNTLKLKITGLTPNSEYFWVIKNEPNQLNDEARNTGVFIQGEIKLTESQLSGTIDGSNTVFTVPSTDFLNFGKVYKNGLEDTDLLIEGTDYTVSSNQITFTVAPTVTDTLQVSYIVNTTEANIDVPLVDTKYSVGSTYYFGVREDENDEGIRVTFKISQNTVLATGTDIIDTLPGGVITYSGFGINSSNNKILDEKSLCLNNITICDNTKIPTSLAVETFVNAQISTDSALNLKIAENLNDLQDKATARTNLDVYSTGQVDNLISTASGDYLKINQNLNDLDNKATARTNLDVYSTTQVNNSLALKQDILNEGAFVDGDKDKLDGIESGATADQTDTEIKTAYENNANTNAYTDAEKTKLSQTETTTQLNARDSANRDRANHTGSQSISTISGLQAELNSKAELTENNTFTGDNTFDNPVSGVAPTANNHLTTRSWSDPSGVVEQVNIVKNRFLAESLTINNWKLAKLEQLYKDILVASEQDTLPEVLLVPDLSADLSSPSSTKLINLGIETGDIAIQNTTVSGIVVNKTFDTSAFVGDEFISTNMHNYTDNFTVFFKTRPATVPSILQDLWASTIVNNTFRMAVMNTSKLRYSIRGIIDVVDSSNNYITTDLNAFAIGQGGGQAFTQVINTSSSARTQIANTTIPASSADVSIFKSGAGSNYRGVTTAIIAFSSFLTDSQINNINDLF